MKLRLVLASAFLALVFQGCKPNSEPPVDFLVSPLHSGEDVKLSSDYKGKPVVVYLWATWCGPCKEFAPTLNEIVKKNQNKGVAFLAISGESKKVIAESEVKDPHKMTVLVDTFSSAAEAIGGNALPTIVVLDKDHRPVWGSRGISPGTETETALQSAIDSVL